MSSPAIVTLTERAAKKIREYFAREGDEEALLRITLAHTHCMGGRGYGYRLAPERSLGPGDITQEAQGFSIVIDRVDTGRLAGTTIDYVDELEHSGFDVQNPQSSGKCPCGHHDLFD